MLPAAQAAKCKKRMQKKYEDGMAEKKNINFSPFKTDVIKVTRKNGITK